ncbi:uncharacterized protein PRCAT00003481001 [Priceomyces carsonii]|uniref:uncharacterized protein n=1 Tax=Priceomyces carsonii TaxID=28549 RepID=UPI002EDA2C5D|nr:unnamed protein product [Priceomyces carsonii]
MSQQTVFISGGNRGIGFALVKLFSQDTKIKVLTTARNHASATELQELAKKNKNVHVIKLDVNSEESIREAAAAAAKVTNLIDIFISNSGIGDITGSSFSTERGSWIKHYNTNVLGPILLLQEFYPLIKKGGTKKVFFISSVVASITMELPIPRSAYGQSKAALNYTVKEMANELKSEGFTLVLVHPGVVGTDMGKDFAEKLIALDPKMADFFDPSSVITPDQSAEALEKLFLSSKPENNGKFLSYDGLELPW